MEQPTTRKGPPETDLDTQHVHGNLNLADFFITIARLQTKPEGTQGKPPFHTAFQNEGI